MGELAFSKKPVKYSTVQLLCLNPVLHYNINTKSQPDVPLYRIPNINQSKNTTQNKRKIIAAEILTLWRCQGNVQTEGNTSFETF